MTDTTTSRATVATLGFGRSIHFAYYVGDNLTGTYCDRAAWESKRVRPHHGMRAEQVTCSRCLKVAASETSVPNSHSAQGQRQEPTSYSFTHHADGTERGNHPSAPSAYLVHAWSTCHAVAPEDLVADPSQLLPTCGDCLEQVATAATPRPLTISMTAVCAHCGQELSKTLDAGLDVGHAWYHSATGAEECATTH